MIRLFLALVLLVSISREAQSLSDGEMEALKGILEAWPILGTLDRPWNASNVARACVAPTWYGLRCSMGADPRVVSFSCDGVSLNGPLPSALSGLIHLQQLFIYSCGVTGGLDSPGLRLSSLSTLELSQNRFTGSLPQSLVSLSSLFTLDLSEDGIRGPIPATGWTPNLLKVALDCPHLSGPILSALSNSTHLSTLIVKGDRFDPFVPSSIKNWQYIDYLRLDGLSWSTGPLWPTLVQLKSLTKLSLQLPHRRDTLPPNLGSLSRLDNLDLSLPLYGTIPPSIGNLTRLRSLSIRRTSLEGPIPPEIASLTALTTLSITRTSSPGLGSLPSQIGNLTSLSSLTITYSKLVGTIPPDIVQLTHLLKLDLSGNNLCGSIPPLPPTLRWLHITSNKLEGTLDAIFRGATNFQFFVLSYNRLSGTIPARLWEHCPPSISLDNNRLEGTLPDSAFEKGGLFLDLHSNNLTGPLPTKFSAGWARIILSNNRFNGTIPYQYALVPALQELSIDHNCLTGTLDDFQRPNTSIPSAPSPEFEGLLLDASYNLLSGQLPNLSNWSSLRSLILSYNNLDGTIPVLPSSIRKLVLRHNEPGISDKLSSLLGYPSLEILDLSHNSIYGTLLQHIFLPPFTAVNLASNKLQGDLPLFVGASSLRALDLSYNQLSMDSFVLSNPFPSLVSLIISHNDFSGSTFELNAEQLTHLDISFNSFSFAPARLTVFSNLNTLNARSNYISGTFGLITTFLPSLKSVDLSQNQLDDNLHLLTLHSLFNGSLQQLHIEQNPAIPTIYSFSEIDGPWRTTQNQPSPSFPALVECFTLTFNPSSPYEVFIFDENLFNYRQCDCMNGYYGIPPFTCYTCPPHSSCEAKTLNVKEDYFVFSHTTQSTRDTTDNNLLDKDLEQQTQTQNGALESLLETEDCIVSLAVTESNCLGLNLAFEHDASTSGVLELFNSRSHDQCLPGSGGRLCSRCECDLSNHPTIDSHDILSNRLSPSSTLSCFYKRGFKCSRCSTTFTLSQSIPFVVGIVIVIFIILTIIMIIVLRGRRQVRNKRWEDLSVSKRIWYRLVDTSKSGLISILVLFIQIFVVLTHWDVFLIRTLAQMMNGNIESLGLVCLFPSLLTNPLTSLALQLTLPLLVSTLAAVSVGCAHLLSLWIDRRSSSQSSSSNFYSDLSDMDDSSSTSGLLETTHNHSESRFGDYPALELILSNTISILQFFYFGTSLAATEYFFSSVQSHTGLKYVQAHPWMLYNDATSLRGLSIPWLIFVVIGFPITFVIFSWLIRHKPTSPNITSYIGSLFSRYRHRVFWWEIVNVMKKLTIALLIRGISASNPMQVASITLSIGIPMLVQSAVRPWKRYWENVMDSVGSILLISSLGASTAIRSTGSLSVLYLLLSLVAIYVVAMIVMIIHQLFAYETEYQRLWNITFGKTEILSDGFIGSNDTSTNSSLDGQ